MKDRGRRRCTRCAAQLRGGMGAVAPMANLDVLPKGRAGADHHRVARVHRSLVDGFLRRSIDEERAGRAASDLQITVWRTGHVNALVGKSKSSLAPTCAGQTQVRHKTPMFLRIPVTWVRIVVRVRIQLFGLRMFDSTSRDSEPGRAVGEGAPLAGEAADAQPAPRVVTTGRKNHPRDRWLPNRITSIRANASNCSRQAAQA